MILYAEDVKKMFLSGAHALNEQKDYINELNVFPVPDGDTGTNMTMTIISSAKEVVSQQDDTMDSVCRAISSGALRGARGNSGVILSQLFRGFCKTVRDLDSISTEDLIRAMQKAVDSAYKAVMKPKEGTILSVARGMAEKAVTLSEEENIAVFLKTVIEAGDEMLQKTPEMLPVLKQAGVVDSGGQGLMSFMHGIYEEIIGKRTDFSAPVLASENVEEKTVDTSGLETSDIRFFYCTEFIIKTKKPLSEAEELDFKAFLESIGDSVVCVFDEDVVKVHVHTNDPGLAIQRALTYGELSRMKIDNMHEEHEERLFKAQELKEAAAAEKEAEEKSVFNAETAKEVGFIGVAAGEGLEQILRSLDFDVIVGGGQTMNPSTEDFLSAIAKVNAKNIFIFPNNGNIILAASQAASMTEEQNIIVIPTKTVPECITAKIAFDPYQSVAGNTELMTGAAKTVTTAEVTYAVRDTEIDGVTIRKGDFMALSGKHILACEKVLNDCVKKALSELTKENGQEKFVTVYYGSDLTEEDAACLLEEAAPFMNGADSDIEFGGQPVYYYLISVEEM